MPQSRDFQKLNSNNKKFVIMKRTRLNLKN